MLNNKMLKIIFSTLIIFFSISNLFADETYILNWEKLVPKNAYDFVPKDGGSDELWQNKSFLKKIDLAGLKINENLVGKKIKLYGFMVPLEMDYNETLMVNQFVLVPSGGMCIHVPPPPPNQMVFVKLKKPVKARYMYNPISVEGVLINTKPIKEVYNSIYEITVNKIEDIDQDLYVKLLEKILSN
tara:strand:- start:31 stop:588 length:558 start_codon:yes stop_codon:yes gene_type:complete